MSKRIDIKNILKNKYLRRELMVGVIIATQAREEIITSREQAEKAYDVVLKEKNDTTYKQRKLNDRRN